jgi:hypothetical protein
MSSPSQLERKALKKNRAEVCGFKSFFNAQIRMTKSNSQTATKIRKLDTVATLG